MLLKGDYAIAVLQSVTEVAQEHEEDVLHMLPQLGQTLAKQRRNYVLNQVLVRMYILDLTQRLSDFVMCSPCQWPLPREDHGYVITLHTQYIE